MSIQTTVLKYGWSIVAGVVLTGATIFTSDSTLKYITQRDAIQVILGTVERCLATQTGTNVDGTAIYAVAPPSFVRSWVSTNGLTGTNFAWVTNQVTNSISWYTDRAMMVALDAKIFALIPYYVNANTVYDGATNISMLTVTGLFASLQIGDHTNQFTATPCWTNNAGTTNATTNAATFGPWAQLNYRVAWQERYKVLNALKMTQGTIVRATLSKGAMNDVVYFGSFAAAQANAESKWPSDSTTNAGTLDCYSMGFRSGGFHAALAVRNCVLSRISSAEINHKNYYYMSFTAPLENKDFDYSGYDPDMSNPVFDDNGSSFTTNGWNLIASGIYETSNSWTTSIGLSVKPNWCQSPTQNNVDCQSQGFQENGAKVFTDWQFNYCTNKYW